MVIFFFGECFVFFIVIRRPNLAREVEFVCAWERRKILLIGTQSDGDAKSKKNIVCRSS